MPTPENPSHFIVDSADNTYPVEPVAVLGRVIRFPMSGIRAQAREAEAAGHAAEYLDVALPQPPEETVDPDAPYCFYGGRIVVVPGLSQIHVNGEDRRVTPQEYKLVAKLARKPNRVVGRTALLDAVLPGADPRYVSDPMISVAINRTRRKLYPIGPDAIRTQRGAGYFAARFPTKKYIAAHPDFFNVLVRPSDSY